METFVTDAINNNTERDCRLALSPCVAIPGGSLTLQLPTLGVVFIRLGPGNNIFLAGTLMTGLFLAMIHLRQSLRPSLQVMMIYSESW